MHPKVASRFLVGGVMMGVLTAAFLTQAFAEDHKRCSNLVSMCIPTSCKIGVGVCDDAAQGPVATSFYKTTPNAVGVCDDSLGDQCYTEEVTDCYYDLYVADEFMNCAEYVCSEPASKTVGCEPWR